MAIRPYDKVSTPFLGIIGQIGEIKVHSSPLQYPHLFANWKVIYTEAKIDGSRKVHEEFKYYQPMHVLEKNSEKPGFGHSDL